MDEGSLSCLDFIRRFDYETGKENALSTTLQEICRDNKYLLSLDQALPKDCEQKLVDIFCKCHLSRNVGRMVLQILVPQTKFNSEYIGPFILWLLTENNREKDLVVDLLLWFSKLVEYGKLEKILFQGYYATVVHLLSCERQLTPVCYFLMVTAHPKFVTRRIVQLAVHYYQSCENKDIAALLQVYNKFHPSFIKIQLPVKTGLPNIKIASSIETAFRMTKPKDLNIFTSLVPSENYGFSKHGSTDYLPVPFYFQTTIPGGIKFVDLVSFEELGKNIDKVILPNNSLSLLNTRIGFHLLVVRKDVHRMFLVDLAWALENPANRSWLLSRIATFQECLLQGLPPIYTFLSEYLITWDGVEDREVILRLIPWVHFNTFEQFSSQFLDPIIRLFVTSEVEMKVAILNSIGKLIINMILQIERLELNFEPLFGYQQPYWLTSNPHLTLYQIVLLTIRLIRRTLVSEFRDSCAPSLYLFHALNFFELMSFLEVKYDLQQFTVIIPEIGYSSLFTRNIAVLSKLCSLLVRYKKVVIPCLDQKNIANEFTVEIDILSKLNADLTGFLCKGKVGSHLYSCSLLEDMPKEIVAKVNSALELKTGLTVRRHEAIATMITLLALKASRNPDSLSDNEWMLFLKDFGGGIFDFVEEFK